MSNYIREQEKENIWITDIYWDRIYLHLQLQGENIYEKEYVIATRKERYLYPVMLDKNKNEIVINITNIQEQKMLQNGDWYIKYLNKNYEEEMLIYEKEEYNYNKNRGDFSSDSEDEGLDEEKENESDENGNLMIEKEVDNEKPWIPYLWKDIPLTMEACYKLKDLDKVYRYSGNNYAYIFTFSPLKTRDELICRINSTFMLKNRKPEKRYFSVESAKKRKVIKKALIFYLEQFLNSVYQLATACFPKKGKNILLMSETRDLGGNLKALDERLKERGLDKEFKISYHFSKTLEQSRSKIFFTWLKLALLTAKQDFIFVDDYVPFFKYINVSKKTTLIQVWHAGVGFKSVGYARFGEKGSPYPFAASHRRYDYAIVGGEALRDVYAEVFGIDRENCLPYGLMRIDGYLEPQKIDQFKQNFYHTYEQFRGKKIILFAPTFRGTGQRKAHYPYDIIDQQKIYDMCGEEYVFLIKMHPFILKRMEIDPRYSDRIIEFSDFPDINELFYVTDILITDYSSNIYEFSLQKKPIVFFAYDKLEYELIRSVHRTLDQYAPGKVCTTIDEVVETIETKDFEMEKLYRFVKENFDETEGYASDKVIDNILLCKE